MKAVPLSPQLITLIESHYPDLAEGLRAAGPQERTPDV